LHRRFVWLWFRLRLDGFRRRVQLGELCVQSFAELPERRTKLKVGGFPHLPANLVHQFELSLLDNGGLPRVEVLQHGLDGLVAPRGFLNLSLDPGHGVGNARDENLLDPSIRTTALPSPDPQVNRPFAC
jgi:hypothetical protein